jgi:hypothetical protein
VAFGVRRFIAALCFCFLLFWSAVIHHRFCFCGFFFRTAKRPGSWAEAGTVENRKAKTKAAINRRTPKQKRPRAGQ